jgi:hypothetical protein
MNENHVTVRCLLHWVCYDRAYKCSNAKMQDMFYLPQQYDPADGEGDHDTAKLQETEQKVE